MKFSFTLLVCVISLFSYSQNVGIGTTKPQNKLHVAGGLRVDSLANAKDSGLILHNKTGDVYSLKLTGKKSDILRGDGTFAAAAAATDAWLLGGNAGTNPDSNFIGTTDDQPLRFRLDDAPSGIFTKSSVFLGYGSPEYPWENNAVIGPHAMQFGAGTQNVAIGVSSMYRAVGDLNTAVGFQAFHAVDDPDVVTTGHNNTALGATALASLRGGNNNTAVGSEALHNTEVSNTNTAVGFASMSNFNGTSQQVEYSGDNVAIGAFSMQSAQNGAYNTAIGYQAIYSAELPNYLTAVGYHSMYHTTTGVQNTAMGTFSFYNNTTGSDNSAFGHAAMGGNTSGSNNTAFGATALPLNTTGSRNSGFGFGALSSTTGSDNTAVGYAAGRIEGVSGLTAVGAEALNGNLGGTGHVAVGYRALFRNTTGNGHTATGYQALMSNTTGTGNTAMGTSALQANTIGNYNTASGNQSLFVSTTGSYNSGFGYKTMFSNTTGSNNTATGFKSLNFNTAGNRNTATGFEALNTNTTGNDNTAIGYRADVTSANLSNATAIGFEAKVDASNKVRIGNASVTVIEGQVPFTTPSDGRFKFNVKENVGGLDFIMKLRPVTYQFDVKRFDNIENVSFVSSKNDAYEKAAMIRRTGFIAQEVEKAADDSHYDFSGVIKPGSSKEHYSLSYESFVVPLVKAVQQQQGIISKLEETVNAQNEKIKKQQQLIDQLIKELKK